MSIQTPPTGAGRAPGTYDSATDAGGGWVTFAGVILSIVGVMNIIGGIGAIDDSQFFAGNTKYVLGDLHTWGWVILILGAAQLLTAFGLWARSTPARWLGVGFASLNAIALLLMLPAYPLWSLALFSLDIIVIYQLATYGARNAAV